MDVTDESAAGTGAGPRQRLVVLASGSGTNLQALLDAVRSGRLGADVVAVVCNRDAPALGRARDAGVPAVQLTPHDGEARPDYDARLADVVEGFDPHWVVLAGWMRILTMRFLGRFPDRVVNLHPALPGELPGVGAIERAWDESLAGTRTRTGVMVHLVPDEGVDDGPVLGTTVVDMTASADFDDFAASVHAAEHELLVDVLAELVELDDGRRSPIPSIPSPVSPSHTPRKAVT